MDNYIITIAREYASGGRLIGKKLAEELGIEFYDKEIIALAAKESGLTEEYIESADETRSPFFMYNVYGYANVYQVPELIYIAESNVIRSLAEKGSCVFIGRNASRALEDKDNLIKIFIHAPMEYRTKFAIEVYGDDPNNTKNLILRKDKGREEYSRVFSGYKWRDLRNYHLTVDSSIGVDATVDTIKKYIDNYLTGKKEKE